MTFSVQKPMENPVEAGGEKKKSNGQKRRERRKRMNKKLKATSEEKETVKDQEVTTREVVSNDAEASEEVFEEDLETDELNPRTRLRVRSRRLVLSVGAGEAVARPSNPNKTIEQLDGVNELDKDESVDELERKDDGNIELTVNFDLTISALSFLDAFGSIEENLCNDEDESKILISNVPSRAVIDEKNEGNTLYTLEIKSCQRKDFFGKT